MECVYCGVELGDHWNLRSCKTCKQHLKSIANQVSADERRYARNGTYESGRRLHTRSWAEGHRICTVCKEQKPREMFYKSKTSWDGVESQCKSCRNERTELWKKKNPNRVKDINMKASLVKYGISLEEYKELLCKQDSRCAICGCTSTNDKRVIHRLVVDHNHSTGKVRGLLCNSCNTGLGMFLDNKQLMVKATKYLEEYSE